MASTSIVVVLLLCFVCWFANAEDNVFSQNGGNNNNYYGNEKTFWAQTTPTWGNENVFVYNNGMEMQLRLTNGSGSAVQSYEYFLYSSITISLKLVPGNSAGTVTTFYLYSVGNAQDHDEIDLEFLGNATGEPYTVHTNIYCNGDGKKEEQFRLWFDPTLDFHNYTILWNKFHIVISVDGIPLRVYKNYNNVGIAYPSTKPMKLYASIWNADDWATQGGRVKTDWSAAPFVATYKNLDLQSCPYDFRDPNAQNDCTYNGKYWWNSDQFSFLTDVQKGQMQWARNTSLIYSYCTDYNRFSGQYPAECYKPQY